MTILQVQKKISRFRHNFLAWFEVFTTECHSFNNNFLVPEELPIPIVWLHDYHLMLGIIHILRNLTFMRFEPPLNFQDGKSIYDMYLKMIFYLHHLMAQLQSWVSNF